SSSRPPTRQSVKKTRSPKIKGRRPKRLRLTPQPPPRRSWKSTCAGSGPKGETIKAKDIAPSALPFVCCLGTLALMDLPSAGLRRQVRPSLLNWFGRARRDLPWRLDRDPYHIWVSEIMLQQTQVATVIPFFKRFLRAFPTLKRLAAADEQDVLRLWEGLGYYRRARDLHRAARQIVAQHGGEVADDPAVLKTLPGIGRYTLGAILSQAYDRRLPILEANSQRVLCRLLGLDDDPRREPARSRLWRVAEALLPIRQVGDFNQALMEL